MSTLKSNLLLPQKPLIFYCKQFSFHTAFTDSSKDLKSALQLKSKKLHKFKKNNINTQSKFLKVSRH